MSDEKGRNAKLFSLPFLLVCLGTILFFSSFNLILIQLPAYLTSLGGGSYKGLIISLFTLTALISRPISGKLTDLIGRLPIMYCGAIVSMIVGGLYPFFGTIAGFFVLRLLHGFSTGFSPTGLTAYLSDIVPGNKRGRAMGIFGLCISTGAAIGPILGERIVKTFGYDVLFFSSSALALLSVVCFTFMKETLKNKVPFKLSYVVVNKKDIYEPKVLLPSVIMFLLAYSFGGIFTVVPDFSDYLGVQDKSLFFSCFVGASLFIRLVAGGISDRLGRKKVAVVTLLLTGVVLFFLGFVRNQFELIVIGIVFGIVYGTLSPTLFAWVMDLSSAEHRGRAMATIFMMLEAGIGLGALGSAAIYHNNPQYFPHAFASGGALCIFGMVILLLWGKKKPSISPA